MTRAPFVVQLAGAGVAWGRVEPAPGILFDEPLSELSVEGNALTEGGAEVPVKRLLFGGSVGMRWRRPPGEGHAAVVAAANSNPSEADPISLTRVPGATTQIHGILYRRS
jgi:hypothetical protein